jgi:WD40 repeat protein
MPISRGVPALELRVLDIASGREVWRKEAAVGQLCFSPDGQHLAGGLRDGSIQIWEASEGKEKTTLQAHQGAVGGLAFSSDGLRLASGGLTDKSIKIWDPLSGRQYLTLRGHASRVLWLAFGPDDKRLLSHEYGIVKIWDGRPLAERWK